MKKILIIGATSAIAEATAKIWANKKYRFFLVGRNEERLKNLVADLEVRKAESVQYSLLDVNDFHRHKTVIDDAINILKGVDIVLIAPGTLGDQRSCQESFDLTLQEFNTNAISIMSLLTYLANHFESQKQGTLAVISSVAGDRGRKSNYVYGTAKGAVSIFLQGLRSRLFGSGVTVLTIKLGFVDTPMTAKFIKKGLLWASPESVALGIVGAIENKCSEIYLPRFWAIIMFIIRIIPERIFKRLPL